MISPLLPGQGGDLAPPPGGGRWTPLLQICRSPLLEAEAVFCWQVLWLSSVELGVPAKEEQRVSDLRLVQLSVYQL